MGEIKRRGENPLSKAINIGVEAPKADSQNLTEELGHEPTEFESKLLAFSGDKDGQKKLAVELMLDQAGYHISNLNQIENKEAQKRINELAVEYAKTSKISDASERNKIKKTIAAEVKAILDKTFEE